MDNMDIYGQNMDKMKTNENTAIPPQPNQHSQNQPQQNMDNPKSNLKQRDYIADMNEYIIYLIWTNSRNIRVRI